MKYDESLEMTIGLQQTVKELQEENKNLFERIALLKQELSDE